MLANTFRPPRAHDFANVSATELIPPPCGPPMTHVRLFSSGRSNTFYDFPPRSRLLGLRGLKLVPRVLQVSYPIMVRLTFLRERGPSSSTKKIFCQAPLTSRFLSIRNVRECPRNVAARCASALWSISLCEYVEFCGKRSSIFA